MPESVTTLTFSGNGLVGSKSVTLSENKFETLNGGGSVPVPAEPVETDEWINFNDPAMEVEGLPIWAKYNLGVDKNNLDHAYDWYGDYYAWGEVEPYYTSINWTSATSGSVAGWKTDMTTGAGNTVLTSGYAWKSYSQGATTSFTEWNTHPYGSDNVLTQARDAAYQNATPANTWRMPTGGAIDASGNGEWQALFNSTLWVWTTSYRGITNLKGYVVYKVKAKAHKGKRATSSGNGDCNYSGTSYVLNDDPHMFLPAAGYRVGTSLNDAGSHGYYWSSSLYSSDPDRAYRMRFNSGCVYPQLIYYRCRGFSVRPVQ